MEINKIKVVSIVGPTASGKTKLSVNLARKFSGEIISADSVQVYKEFNILSAKPTTEEISIAKHHLIDFLSVEDVYSVAQFKELASKCIKDVNFRGKLPILVGGTGLYVDSLLKGIDFETPKVKGKVELPEEKEKLMEMLLTIDPESAVNIHINNVKRLKRALEFYYSVGYPISKQVKHSKEAEPPYDVCKIGLNFRDRAILYSSINSRVNEMIKSGLLSEVYDVYKNKSVSKTAQGAIGYKEIVDYIESRETLENAYENVKMYSRRYAKRQLTWFRRDESINWIYIDDYKNFSEVIDRAEEIIEKFMRR